MDYRFVVVACALAGCGPRAPLSQGDDGGSAGGSEGSESSAGSEATTADGSDAEESSSGAMLPADPFADARLVTLEHTFHGFTAGDYDGDGDDDLLVSYEYDRPLIPESVQRLALFALSADENTFENTFEQDVDIALYGLVPGHVDAGSTLDVIAADSLRQIAWIDDVFVVAPSTSGDARLGPVRDIDDDGLVEYLEHDGDVLRTHGADGSAGWELEQVFANESECYPGDAQWGDIDGNGRLDLAVHERCDESSAVRTFLQGDDGSFAFAATYVFDSFSDAVDLVDLDGDGALDLLATGIKSQLGDPTSIAAWLGTGDGAFAEPPIVFVLPEAAFGTFIAPIDVDDDGSDEAIIWTSLAFPEISAAYAVLRVEAGAFVVTDPLPSGMTPLLRADVDGDGCGDIVGQASGVSGISVLLRACN